uniref:Uncharacterized protein n=1 Tax=Magallana gigas TaxID=29159 RepID=K1PA70_MAGGI
MSDDEWMTKEEKINRYRKFMTKNDCYDDYLTLHSNIGKWAEDVIIQASADKYCLHIFVSFYTNHNEVIRTVAKPVQAERENYKRIFLKLENGHYTIISKDLKVSPEEPWFDLLGPPADGPEQYQYELPEEDWFDLLFSLEDGTEKCKCDKGPYNTKSPNTPQWTMLHETVLSK